MHKSQTVFSQTKLQLPSFRKLNLVLDTHLCPLAITSIASSRKLVLSCSAAFRLEHPQPSCPSPGGVGRTGPQVPVPSVASTLLHCPTSALLRHLLAYPRHRMSKLLWNQLLSFLTGRNLFCAFCSSHPHVLSLCHPTHTCKSALRAHHQGHCHPSCLGCPYISALNSSVPQNNAPSTGSQDLKAKLGRAQASLPTSYPCLDLRAEFVIQDH